MNNKNTTAGLQGSRLPTIAKNGAVLLDKEYRDRLVAIANAICNLEVIVPQTDGSNVLPPLKAQIDISELTMRITMPPASPGGGTSSTVPFSGSGAPSATTLSSAASYVAGPVPSLYVDTTGLNLWVCTTAGTNATSAWMQISSGGGSGVTPQFLAIISDAGTYWIAQASGAAVSQNVIKDPLIGTGIASRIIRGITYSYTYTPVAVGAVTGYYTRGVSGSDGSSETDVLIPDPISADIICCLPVSGTPPVTVPFTILTAAIATPGTGYTAGTYSIAGGTGTHATVTITVNGSGVVTSATPATPGSYSGLPTLTAATIIGGGGAGATFNLTPAPVLFDQNTCGRYWAS